MSQQLQATENIVNLNDAMENLDGDIELLQEVLEIFQEMVPEQMDTLEAAVQAGQAAEVCNVAHSLKGSASNFCATRFVATAFELEQSGRAGELDGAREMMDRLRVDYAELIAAFGAIDWDSL